MRGKEKRGKAIVGREKKGERGKEGEKGRERQEALMTEQLASPSVQSQSDAGNLGRNLCWETCVWLLLGLNTTLTVKDNLDLESHPEEAVNSATKYRQSLGEHSQPKEPRTHVQLNMARPSSHRPTATQSAQAIALTVCTGYFMLSLHRASPPQPVEEIWLLIHCHQTSAR